MKKYWFYLSRDPDPADLSYVKGFNEWGGVIGSGIYVNDLNKEFQELFTWFLIAGTISTLGVLAFSLWMARSVSRPVLQVMEHLRTSSDQLKSMVHQISSTKDRTTSSSSATRMASPPLYIVG